MWTLPIEVKCQELTVKGQARFYKDPANPDHELVVFCPRPLDEKEAAAVLKAVLRRLTRKRLSTTVRVFLEDGDFSVALKALGDLLNPK